MPFQPKGMKPPELPEEKLLPWNDVTTSAMTVSSGMATFQLHDRRVALGQLAVRP